MKYDFDSLPVRRGTQNMKWNTYAADVLPMFVADMDFVSPAPVVEALRRQVDSGMFGYPDGLSGSETELPVLRRVIVDRMMQRYNWKIRPQDVIFVPGVVVGFNLACQAVGKPGDAILIQPPVYPPINGAGGVTQRSSIEAELVRQADGSYGIDWDAFKAACARRPGLFLLCNPQNPTGRVFRPDELEKMAEICLAHGAVICSDEIHSDLVYGGSRHVPVASLHADIAAKTITLIAPSKTFNLAGLQCSVAIIQDPGLRRQYLEARRGVVAWVNLMGLIAAEAAYIHGQEWLDQLLVYLEANRNFACDYVREEMPLIRMTKPEGTYLGWLDCRGAAIEGNPYRFFLNKARVALGDGNAFGRGGEGFVRLNFGCPRSMLAEALERMRTATVGLIKRN